VIYRKKATTRKIALRQGHKTEPGGKKPRVHVLKEGEERKEERGTRPKGKKRR